MPHQPEIEAAWRPRYRDAVHHARRLTGMLQGTMGLEGQALDRATLRQMERRTAGELLARVSSAVEADT